MKRFPNRWTARAAAVAIGLQALSAAAPGQDKPVISARPGQRPVRELPAATQGSVSLSLDQAIGLALSNNQDLNVTVNAAESTRFSLFQTEGIYDPLVTALLSRSHSEQPATSVLVGVGANVNTSDFTDARAQVSQLAPTGGIFTLGFTGNKTTTNSTFFFINPSYSSGLQLSMNQPLLRNFGSKTTTWLIRIARNTRDSAYQDFVRSAQSVVNSVEQAYWDLVYSLQNLEVKKESLRIAQDLNRITKIKIDVGSLAPIEITQTEVGIATAEQDIITAEGLIGDAQDRLQRVLNVDPTRWFALVVPTDEVRGEDVKIGLDEGTKTALTRRPEVLQAAILVDSDRIRYDYYSNQALPGLNLTASYGNPGIGGTTHDPNTGAILSTGNFGDSFQQVLDRKFKNWSVGLNFSYPILNRAARGAYGASKYLWESDKARLTTTRQNVVVEVRAAARAIDTARRSIVAAQKGRELAEKNLDAGKKKFDNGMATSFEVTQIQRDLSVARTAELQALTIYRKALAAYHFATADILDWKGVQIEGLPETTPPPLSGITAERR
jgi:outer membrane protein TolC